MRRSATAGAVRARNTSVAALFAAVLLLLTASVALAQETVLGGKLRTGDRVVVAAGEVVEGDLYASGREVRVDGTVNGDLLATGAQVVVTGEVTGDVMAAAGTIGLSGRVGGDARVAGGQVDVSGPIAEDLFVAGGQATVSTSGEVGEDLVFGVGTMTLDGPVAGDILGSAGAYTRQGTVGGTETVTINEPEQRQPTAADRTLGALRRVISILLIAALVLWLAPRVVEAPVGSLRRQPLLSLVIGLAGLVGAVVLVLALILSTVLLAVLLGLLGLGSLVGAVVFALITLLIVLAFALFLVLAFGAPIIVGATLGDLVLPQDVAGRRWWAVIGGVVVIVLVASIPVIGGFVGFLVAVFGLGALLLTLPFVGRSPEVEPAQEPA